MTGGAWQAQRAAEGALPRLYQGDEGRVDVALARDGGRVAEPGDDGFEQRLQAEVRLGAGQRLERGDAGAPGTEMLGGEIAAGRALDIIVDVGRGDGVLHLAHRRGEPLVGDRDIAFLAGFALVAQLKRVAADGAVALAQRRGAVALVRFGIGFVADAQVTDVEQAHDRGDSAIARQAACGQVRLDAGAQLGQAMAEIGAFFVFRRLLRLAEAGVIAILLAPLLIPADRLDMAIGLGAKPGVAIGGGQADRVQPVDLVTIGDPVAVGRIIGPAIANLAARDAGLGIIAIDYACGQLGTPFLRVDPALRGPFDPAVEEDGRREDQREIEGDDRPGHRSRIADGDELECLPQQEVRQIGRVADVAERVEPAPLERMVRRAGGQRQCEQQRGERQRRGERLGAAQRPGCRADRGDAERPGERWAAQEQRGKDRAGRKFGEAADEAVARNVPAQRRRALHRDVQASEDRRCDGHQRKRGQASPVDRQDQQWEQQIGGEFAADRPGRIVPAQRIGDAPILHQQHMQRQFGEGKGGVAAPGRPQRERQRDGEGQHDAMQRPDARDALLQEAGDAGGTLPAQSVMPGQPDDETGQEEEEVDREIALGEHRLDAVRQARDASADMVEDDQPRSDAPGRDEWLEGDGDERRAEQIDEVRGLERGGEGARPAEGAGGIAIAAAQHLHADEADQADRKPQGQAGITLFAQHFEIGAVIAARLVGHRLIGDGRGGIALRGGRLLDLVADVVAAERLEPAAEGADSSASWLLIVLIRSVKLAGRNGTASSPAAPIMAR
ncbi:hypothetical protein WR25_25235 [Diploscapter pachys]|uniref:Uncharacterized protein n=1 Tax=Diploscapter pachys TaxID=2018661 RepID=A0A2A2M259_9BILA|nr:hypothetical protein WR25_25235 [Diploscapter pachys]